MSRYLVTGGAGFIGSHFCELALSEKWCTNLLNVDALTYAGNPENLKTVSDRPEFRFERVDISDESFDLASLIADFKPTKVFHFAAESHVDRSIVNPSIFLKTNVLGTFQILRATMTAQEKLGSPIRFVYVSTDEVYGSLGLEGTFTEQTPLSPRSPYSVSKAAGDMLTSAFFHTYNMDSVIVRCSNNYGPRQFPEKLIPQTIIRAMQDKSIPVYGKGDNIRDWIYVKDFARGVHVAGQKGVAGEAYNFGGRSEVQNLKVVENILSLLGKPKTLIEFVQDRKGHDFRYSMNFDKSSKALGWQPTVTFETGLAETVKWYQSNEGWWQRIQSGEYQTFFDSYYSKSVKVRA